MKTLWEVFSSAINGSLQWTWRSITFDVPWYTNYFWGLILISVIVWIMEIVFPWRKQQSIFRKDFWLDAFYMFFNFFIFSIVISGFYGLLQVAFASGGVKMDSVSLITISSFPQWAQLLLFFIVLDLVQWFTHILLHK